MNGGTQGPGDAKAMSGRRYFSLSAKVSDTIRYIELGILFALPIVVAVFSKRYAFAIVSTELISYYLGGLIIEFDTWYNSISLDEAKEMEEAPKTELEIILARLSHFEYKYPMSIKTMYLFLDRNEIPYDNNLDWIEIVSLLNQLSLYIGKRFEEETEKGIEK